MADSFASGNRRKWSKAVGHLVNPAKSKPFCACEILSFVVLIKLFKIYRQGAQTGMAEFHATPVYQESLPGVVQLELEGNQNAMALRRPFDPVAHDLDSSFRLSRFADLKG